MLRMLAIANSKASMVLMMLKIGFGIESVALIFIGLMFITFGILMVVALRKKVAYRIFQERRRKAARKVN